MNKGPKRIGVLFSRLSGYMVACLRQLKDRHGIKLLVIRHKPASNAPFDEELFSWIDHLLDSEGLRAEEMSSRMKEFNPDGIFMAGWVDKRYLEVARAFKRSGVPVIAGSDSQWNGTFKQYLGILSASQLLHPAIDVLWVSGERQRQFAYRLGFKGESCWTGYYSCDWDRFAVNQSKNLQVRSKSFLFVGRYVPVKGIDVLIEGYEKYREKANDSWNLQCVGTGHLDNLLSDKKGIENIGFVQPGELPEIMWNSSALVLPSRKEPWGVVIQEAAAAGLPIICSDVCGAGVHLVAQGFNGYIFQSENSDHLAESMLRISSLPFEKWKLMSSNSYQLSRQFTPEIWADTLINGLRKFIY